MKRFSYFILMLVASILTIAFAACGGGDDDNGSSGGNGGGNGGGGINGGTTVVSVVGTWRAYYQSNDASRGRVYDLVQFNADHTGYVVEEVGYGSDNPLSFTWTQNETVISIVLEGNYAITWTILQIIDNNNVTISDGKRTYNVVRDGTEGGGGNTSSSFVSKGGGSLTVAQLLGTWQVYHVEYYAVEGGQVYNQSYEIYANDQSKGMTTCYRYEFYADYTYKRTEYYDGEWIAPRNNSYREAGGRIYLPEGGSPAPEYCMVTAHKTRSDEIVITTHYTDNDQYAEFLLERVEGGGTPAANPVLGTYNFTYQSYFDDTPLDYYGGFVTITEDPDNTFGQNSINIAGLYLEDSNLVGFYDHDKDSVYIAAWQTIGITDGYGLVAVNWKETKADLIPFSVNIDGSLTSDCFGIAAYDSVYVNYTGWWEAATIATLTPTHSASARKTSARRSVATKAMRINKVLLSNKRVKK